MRTDHWRNDFFYSIKNKVHPKKLVSPHAVLIRFLILTISLFLLFSITADDQSQISYASENLTGTNSSNVSSELIDPSGTVTSWAGYPVSGLTVSAWQGSNLISQTVTDGNGAYNLDLAPGTYDLTAGGTATGGEEQKEYLPQTQQVDVQEPVTVNFRDMLLKNSLYGVITDENGNPLQYTMAEVYDDEGNCIDDNDAGADGHYKLDLSYYFSQQDLSVTSGNFWVVFYGDYLLEQEFNVQVNRDEAYRLDAIMQNATILQGTVTGQATAIDDGTDATSEVILYFTDPNGNEGTDYCSIGHTKNYYFEVDPSMVTVHHIGMTVYGYHDYYQPINLTSGQVNIHNITLVEKSIITVNVTNSTNQPLNGASVSVQSESFDYLLYTDTDGMLSFAVEDDDWTVCATYPDDDYVKVVKNLTVSGGGITLVDIILIQSGLPVVMEGYVTDALDGSPLASTWITFWPSTHPTQTWTMVRTDANGYYRITTDPNHPDFVSGASGYLEIEPIGHEKPRIFITIGQEGQGQNIHYDVQLMPYTGSITVYTKDINDQPVSGVTVDLWGDEDQEMIPDAEGKVVFERVGPSEWWELYIYDYNDNYYTWDSYYYPLEDGQNLEVTAYLVPTTVPAEIKGNVLDPDGAPVSNAKVELYLINSGNWIFTWNSKTTDSLGYFSLNLYGTSANLMRVIISKLGYQNATYDFLPGDLPVNQNFLLNLESLTEPVSGYVYDYFGNPLQGVQIEALENGANVATFFTDLSGEFNFELLAGNYQLIVSHPGYLSQSDDFNLAVGGEYQVNFELLKNGSLYGVITGFQNAPVNGATVNLIQNSNVIDSTISNANGQYQTNSLNPGDYIVQIEAPYYEIVEQGPFVISDATASYQSFVMQPTATSSIHGLVTDENTGLPIQGANVALYFGEDIPLECTTDDSGSYSFINLMPRTYGMTFTATDYVQGYENPPLGVGQDLRLNKVMEPLMPGTIEGTVDCWAGLVSGATVTLDGTITVTTGPDGSFQFNDVAMGYHWLMASKEGVESFWSPYLNNGETISNSMYLNTKVLETNPNPNTMVDHLNQLNVKVLGCQPGASGANIAVSFYGPNPYGNYGWQPLPAGTINYTDDWIIYTPSGGSFSTQRRYKARITIGSEIDYSWEFYVYSPTSNPPEITRHNPTGNIYKFIRMSGSSLGIGVDVCNDAANGLSTANSGLFFDGVYIPTTISGGFDFWSEQGKWDLSAIVTPTHGWHTITAVAVDNQGLRTQYQWKIFTSLMAPEISDLYVTPIFSPNTDGMSISAKISEPIRDAVLYFGSSFIKPLELGDFNQGTLGGWWNGLLESGYWYGDEWHSDHTYTPDDGVVSFTITGRTTDGLRFNVISGSTIIDSHAPLISFDPIVHFNTNSLTINGTFSDYSGVSTFDVTSTGATVQRSFSNSNFSIDVQLNTDGKYEINCVATDPAGNVGQTKHTFWVDRVIPNITIDLAPGEEVRPGKVITFRLDDNLSGLALDYTQYHPIIPPQKIQVLLDGVDITQQVTYSDCRYGYVDNIYPHGELVTLLGVTGTYNPKLYGFLNDGFHTLKIIVKDCCGNEKQETLSFFSITKDPEVSEKDMYMRVNANDQTVWLQFNVKENSDRGFSNFQLSLDGSVIPESFSFSSSAQEYAGTLYYSFTRNFTPGPHTLNLIVTDGLGLTTSLDTGFYYDPRLKLSNHGFSTQTSYVPDLSQYTGNHEHEVRLDYAQFIAGSQAIYGYCSIYAPSNVLYDPTIPMGFQNAVTIAQSPYVNAIDTSYLSLWMTDIIDTHNSYWGWGDSISIYFTDGAQTIPSLDPGDIDTESIIYAHHEAPWINVAGMVDKYINTALGVDGKIWKQYVIPIPQGLDKSHLSVMIAWRTVNWNSWGSSITNSISSKVDCIEFFTPVITEIYPPDDAAEIALSPTVSAKFRLPMDPTMFTDDYFYLTDLAGNKIFTTNSFNQATGWGNMVPNNRLDGLTEYTAHISPDIRTIYGRILPDPSPYSWSFTTREGESARWQTIWYNGEQYDIYLTFGPDYNGYEPGYISPSTIASQAGAPLLGIYITKNGYEIADMELKKIILQAAQRKAFYETLILANYGRLISQSNINWVDNGANALSGEFIYYLTYILPGGNSNPVPDARDVIEDTISSSLSDGSTPYQIPGAISQSLSWFSTLISGCDNINSFIGVLQKVQPTGVGTAISESCAGDVLEVAQLVNDELTFQKELWEFVYQTMWMIEVVDQYRAELSYVKSCSSGDTYQAIDHMLSTDSNTIKQMVGEKVAEHIGTQTVGFVREAVWEAIQNTGPYGKALYYICKGFNIVVDKLGIMDVHTKCHTALDQANAEANFYNAWTSTVNLLTYTNHVTPEDVSFVSTSSKLRYDAAGDFYSTLAAACEIAKNWPTSDTAGYNSVLPSYYNAASDYHSRSSTLIPELSGSNNDINALFPLIKAGTTGKPAYIQIGAYSPIALLVTDELGRRIGYDPVTGQNVNDFTPDGGYTGPYTEPQFISIPALTGQLTIQAFGTGTGTYTIKLETYDENGLLISGSVWNGTAEVGVTQIFTLAVDSLGDVFPVDSHPPEITVDGISDGTCYTSTVTPLITVTDTNLEGWFATLNGSNYTGGPVSDEGLYSLFIRATDGINVVYKSISFSIDMTAPQIDLLGFENDGFYQYVHPYLNVTDDNLASVSLNLDGTPLVVNVVEDEGQHSVTATATDGAGHQSSASGSFTIDHTNPTIDIFGLVNDTVYQGGVTPNISIRDLNLLLSNLTLDGNTYNNGSAILNTLRHHLIVDAVDKAGNHATREIWFIVIPNGGVIITYTGGTANSGSTSLNFPTGAVNNDTAVTINQLSEISYNPTTFLFAGQAFNITAVNLQDGTETSQLNQPVVITIHYSDSDVEGLDENSLLIFYWDTPTSTWKPLTCAVDTENNIITGYTSHFSTFALLGTSQQEPSNPQAPENQPTHTTPTISQNAVTTQSSGVISGYPTSTLLISAPLTIPVQSTAVNVPAQQQANIETTSGTVSWIVYALIFLVVVFLIALLSRRIIKS